MVQKLGKRQIRSHRRTHKQVNAERPFRTETSWAKTQEHKASPNVPTVQCGTVLLRINTVRVPHSVMGSVSFPERYLLRFGVTRYNEVGCLHVQVWTVATNTAQAAFGSGLGMVIQCGVCWRANSASRSRYQQLTNSFVGPAASLLHGLRFTFSWPTTAGILSNAYRITSDTATDSFWNGTEKEQWEKNKARKENKNRGKKDGKRKKKEIEKCNRRK